VRVCIVGTGAIGGLIATRLAAARSADVSAIARGATLAALRARGWRLQHGDTTLQAPARVADRSEELGEQDLVVIAVKAPALPQVASQLGPLLGPHTLVLPAMNGVPWWFGHRVAALGDAPLESVDPGGAIARAISFTQVIGCVVHVSAIVREPGLVQHVKANRLIIGEPAGGRSERIARIAEVLTAARFDVEQSADIRRDIWYKLWGNMTMNPLSAITGATGDRILADPLVREFCSAVMREAAAIGARLGCPIDQTPEDRHRITTTLGAFKTSMLQDMEAGRPIELDALVGAVRELGTRLAIPTPNIDALFGIARLFGRVHKLYPE